MEHKNETITFASESFHLTGFFTRGRDMTQKPLVVLIHGGGTNAHYFDNPVYFLPKELSALGYDVLNINRPGHGGNPIPHHTNAPLLDSLPVFVEFIANVYREYSCPNGQKPGIVLIGHSIGAAMALAIAARAEDEHLPVLGVSALGVVPSEKPAILVPEPDPEPGNPRMVIEESLDSIQKFFGPFEVINEEALVLEVVELVFEPGLKAELKEFLSKEWQDRLVNEIFPAVKVPVQYLAAAYELGWANAQEGQPIFDALSKRFVNSPHVEAQLLPNGGHNYEFSKNASYLSQLRKDFLIKVVKNVSANSQSFTSIPILDFSQTTSPATKPRFLAELRDAIVNVGFFYLKNTPIPTDIQETFVKKAIELFDLPLEKKLEIEMVNSKHFLGYARLGAEITAQKPDFREQFDFATELPAPGPEEPLYHNLRGPNQWPDEAVIPGFRAALETYLSEVSILGEEFKTLVAEALDLEPTALHRFFDVPQQNKLKLVKYPPPPVDEADVQGVGPHKDSAFLTYLLQGTPHTGLEVQNKSGAWIPAPPIPGTLVINIGRALEALTGGVCTATTHRVSLKKVNYLDADGKTPLGPRFSFPVFQGIGLDLSAEKIKLDLPSHITDLVRDAEKVKSDAEATFNEMFKGNIGEGTFIARVTSHQDVGARWYPDLLAKALKGQREFRP